MLIRKVNKIESKIDTVEKFSIKMFNVKLATLNILSYTNLYEFHNVLTLHGVEYQTLNLINFPRIDEESRKSNMQIGCNLAF